MLSLLPLLFAHGKAAAHDAAAVLDVLAADAAPYVCEAGRDGHRPLLLRTSIGLARALDDGRYEHMCPSSYQNATAAGVAASSDGVTLATAAVQGAWVSNDSGCTFASLALPDAGLFAYDAAVAGATPVFLARDTTRAVVFAAESEVLRQITAFEREGDDGFTPDSIAAMPDARLLVVGARPSPAIWLLGLTSEGATEVRFDEAPTTLQRLSVRLTRDDGAWLMLTTERGRSFAYLDLSDFSPSIGPATEPAMIVHGPVVLDGVDYAVVDEQLVTLDRATGVATPIATVDWTCLDQLGEHAYACQLYELLELVAIDELGFEARTVFTVTQLSGPSDFCAAHRDDAQAAACEQDWIHLGGENNLITRGGASCPDGSGQIVDDPAEGDVDGSGQREGRTDGEGCVAAPAGSVGALAALGVLATRRRLRRLRA